MVEVEPHNYTEEPTKPKPLKVKPENIPQELKDIPRWVLWRYELRDGKWTKPPYQPKGDRAKSNDSSTWSSFKEVTEGYNSGAFDGIGLVLVEDDTLIGGDFDHCIKDGVVDQEFQSYIDQLKTYTEISPSGKGLRFFGYAEFPEGGKNKIGNIENYDSGRYLTVTGNKINDSELREFDNEFQKFHKSVFGKPEKIEPVKKKDLPKFRFSLEDDELLEKIRSSAQAAKFEALFSGAPIDEYPLNYQSYSEADLALCAILSFWTSKDPKQMDRIFRQSGLYREKWTEARGSMTYGEMTIAKAIRGTTEVYHPHEGSQFVDCSDSGKPYLLHAALADNIASNYPVYYVEELASHKGIALYFEDEGRYLLQGEDGRVSREIDKLAVSLLGEYKFLWKNSTKKDFWSYFDQALKTISIYDFDQHPRLILYKNGIYNAETDKFSEDFNPALLLTKSMDCKFDRELAKPENIPVFMKFLKDVARDNRNIYANNFEPDKEMMDYMKYTLGYGFTGERVLEKFYFFFGDGQNGKSKLLDICVEVGGSYATTININTFTKDKGSKTQDQGYALAGLRGIRFLSTSETKKKTELDSERIKTWTSGKRIKTRDIYKAWTELYPQLKIFIDGNNEVEIDQGMHSDRRFELVPFYYQVPEEKKDIKLFEKLLEERDGIGTWLGLAAHYYCTNSFPVCKACTEAKEEYYEVLDKLKGFIKHMVIFTEDNEDIVTNAEFEAEFNKYNRILNIEYPLIPQNAKTEFKNQLQRHGIRQTKNADRQYRGIKLKSKLKPVYTADDILTEVIDVTAETDTIRCR